MDCNSNNKTVKEILAAERRAYTSHRRKVLIIRYSLLLLLMIISNGSFFLIIDFMGVTQAITNGGEFANSIRFYIISFLYLTYMIIFVYLLKLFIDYLGFNWIYED